MIIRMSASQKLGIAWPTMVNMVTPRSIQVFSRIAAKMPSGIEMISARLKPDQTEGHGDRHAPRDQVGHAVLEEEAVAEVADHGAADPAEELDMERTIEAVGLADDLDVGLRRLGPAMEMARSPDSRVSMNASVITVNATRRPSARRRTMRRSMFAAPRTKTGAQ